MADIEPIHKAFLQGSDAVSPTFCNLVSVVETAFDVQFLFGFYDSHSRQVTTHAKIVMARESFRAFAGQCATVAGLQASPDPHQALEESAQA